MVETRSALKRKAMEVLHSVPLEPATSHYLKTDEEMETEREFLRKYGGGFIRHPDYHRLLGGVTQLIREGAAEWAFGSDGLRSFYWELFTYARYWCSQYSISDIDVLSDNQIRRLISSVDGFCVQMDWAQLRPILPPTAADRFGEVLGELLIYLTVHQRLFENPFWYFDGKEAPDDPDEDPKFGSKLKHLFDEFYKTNPTYGVLWKMQTQRLANSNNRHYGPNPEYGQYNAKRHEAALGGFADDLLASEPFCWLLKELDTSELATKRRNDLIDIFRKAVRTMIKCETWINGQPVLRGIKELGGIFHDRSSLVGLHTYCWRPRMDFWKGRKILVVSRPGLVYVDSINGYSPDTSPRAKEIIGAEVLPMYILGDDDADQDKMVEDDTVVEEVDDKQDEDDEDYVQGRSN